MIIGNYSFKVSPQLTLINRQLKTFVEISETDRADLMNFNARFHRRRYNDAIIRLKFVDTGAKLFDG